MTIEEFIMSSLSADCTLLKRLYEFDHDAQTNKLGYISGLSLLDVEPYCGTILYNPTTTPTNSVAFATSGGDDVHFGLISVRGKFGDLSPIVMTVPMAGDTSEETNFVVGESLHDFLCLGCVHGFDDLEDLAYSSRTALFRKYSQPPTQSDNGIYARFRAEFVLTPWQDIELKLRDLDDKYRPILRFEHGR